MARNCASSQLDVPFACDCAQAGTGDKKFNATKAAAEAAAADVAVVVVYKCTGEGMDRTNLSLDAWQDEMVRTVVAANKNTVVIARVLHPLRRYAHARERRQACV